MGKQLGPLLNLEVRETHSHKCVYVKEIPISEPRPLELNVRRCKKFRLLVCFARAQNIGGRCQNGGEAAGRNGPARCNGTAQIESVRAPTLAGPPHSVLAHLARECRAAPWRQQPPQESALRPGRGLMVRTAHAHNFTHDCAHARRYSSRDVQIVARSN